MKTILSIALLGMLSCTTCWSQTVINSFPAPGVFGGDIAFDGEHLWIGNQDDYILYQISTVDGSIIKTIPTTVRSPYGMTFDGNYLWVCDTENDNIQQVHTLDGNAVGNYPTPKSEPSNAAGLAWDGTKIWSNDYGFWGGDFLLHESDSTFSMSPDGSNIQGQPSIGQGPTGLGFAGGYLVSADSHTDQIFIIDPSTFAPIDSFPSIGGTHPNGITWDGTHLWLSNNESDLIYQVLVESIPTSVPDSPMSIDVSLFPNPTSDFLTVSWTSINPPNCIITDLKGVRQPYTHSTIHENSYSMDLRNLAAGVYCLSIQSGQNVRTKRFVKL